MSDATAGLGLGRFLRLSRDPLGFLTGLREAHGTFVRYRLGPRTLYLVGDPDLVHEVLVAKAGAFHKDRGTEMMRPLLGSGLLTSEDEQHRRQRRALQPAFHQAKVSAYAKVMAEHAQRACDEIQDGEVLDLVSFAMRTTFAIAGSALFGTDVTSAASDVQRALAAAKVSVEQDGEYNSATAGAVARFQKQNGLNVSGVLDAATRRRLGEWGDPPRQGGRN